MHMFNMRSAGAARLNVTRAAQAGTVTPATTEVQAGPDMAGSAVEGVMHPIGHTVDTRTVCPRPCLVLKMKAQLEVF